MGITDFFQKLLRPARTRKSDLASEISGPTSTGIRQAMSGHPAYNITPIRMASLLRQAEQGDEIPYLELAEEMEEKDCHYRSVLATRKLQVAGLEMSVDAASDKPGDVEAADLCREIFPVIRPALFDILDAVGKGFSVSEIVWDLSGEHWKPARIIWRDPRWFGFDPISGDGPFLRDENGLLTPLQAAKFVVHRVKSKSGLPIRGGLARAACWAWLFKNSDLKSWNIFCEVYGHPLRLGKYGQDANKDEQAVLLRAVRDVGRDWAAIIPESMQIEFIAAKAQGNAELFQKLAEYLDMQMSKLVLGQTGTTDTGTRVGTAEAHERVRADIEKADAEALAATITRDVLTPLIRFNFGETRAVPVFHLRRDEPEDLSALATNLARLAPIAPNLVEVSVIRDKFGFPEPAPEAECIGAAPNPPAPSAIGGAGDDGGGMDAENDDAREPETQPRQAAESQTPGRDWLGDLVDESLSGWVPVMEPIRDQLEALAAQCSSYEEFMDRLESLASGMDIAKLNQVLAASMFAARHLANEGVMERRDNA